MAVCWNQPWDHSDVGYEDSVFKAVIRNTFKDINEIVFIIDLRKRKFTREIKLQEMPSVNFRVEEYNIWNVKRKNINHWKSLIED